MAISDMAATTKPPRKELVFRGERPSAHIRHHIEDFFDIDQDRSTYTAEPIDESEIDEANRFDCQESVVSVYIDGRNEPLFTTSVETLWTVVTSDAESLSTGTNNGDCPTDVFQSIGMTAVSSHSTQQMIVASRHIERQAHEIESGEIHTCFQRLSLLGEDLRMVIQYNLLAEEGVDVHIYGFADHDLPEVEKPTVHPGRTEELADSWVVAFDSTEGDADGEAAALVAQERASDEYAGFWTFDPELVGNVIEHMTATYQ